MREVWNEATDAWFCLAYQVADLVLYTLHDVVRLVAAPPRPDYWGGDPLRRLATEVVDLGPCGLWGASHVWTAWRDAGLPGMPPLVRRARLGWLVEVRGETRHLLTRAGAVRRVHAALLEAETARIRALPAHGGSLQLEHEGAALVASGDGVSFDGLPMEPVERETWYQLGDVRVCVHDAVPVPVFTDEQRARLLRMKP